MSKYHNKRLVSCDGTVHDSHKEAMRYGWLKVMERAGEIRDLKTQVSFELIPTQREASNEVYKVGDKKGQLKPGKVIEKSVTYIADFVYTDVKTGKQVVEDTKGFKTKDYIIKRKLMLYIHGIRIKEV